MSSIMNNEGAMKYASMENDIIFGRGNGTNHHKGNIDLRNLMKEAYDEYFLQEPKGRFSHKKNVCGARTKKEISDSIVSYLREQGRNFLTRNDKSDQWIIVEDKDASKKIQQSLRDMRKRRQQQQQRNKQMNTRTIRHTTSINIAYEGNNNNNDADQESSSSSSLRIVTPPRNHARNDTPRFQYKQEQEEEEANNNRMTPVRIDEEENNGMNKNNLLVVAPQPPFVMRTKRNYGCITSDSFLYHDDYQQEKRQRTSSSSTTGDSEKGEFEEKSMRSTTTQRVEIENDSSSSHIDIIPTAPTSLNATTSTAIEEESIPHIMNGGLFDGDDDESFMKQELLELIEDVEISCNNKQEGLDSTDSCRAIISRPPSFDEVPKEISYVVHWQ